jgi:vitamin B12 transporter
LRRTISPLPFLLFFLCSAVFAAELRVQVSDPQGAAVRGARVNLFSSSGSAVASAATSGQGLATFNVPDGNYQVEVLAQSFAPLRAEAAAGSTLRASLKVAATPDTVVVTATQTPLAADMTGSAVSLLDATQLQGLQPVTGAEALRFMPGAVVNAAGRRGGQASLFVRGGESRYNKVIVDGVPVNDPGGIFDFGVLSLTSTDAVELVRGPQSTLYGADAMTSVVQFFSPAGRTRIPELRFGADGGTFGTARGYASVAGAIRWFDYNLFGEQLNTSGQGVNDEFSNSSQGANLGVTFSPQVSLRLRMRHSNNRSGVQSFWNYNGQPLLDPDRDQFARQNNFLASGELTIAAPSRWIHRLRGIEYRHTRLNSDQEADRGCGAPLFLDCDFLDLFTLNRAGFQYDGEYVARDWLRGNFGYEFEVENGRVHQDFSGFQDFTRGLRRNHAMFVQPVLTFSRGSLVGGMRYVHNESFGDRWLPRLAGTYVLWQGNSVFSGTRLRAQYGQGIKAPRLEESFGLAGALGGFVVEPNPNLAPEEARSYEAGVQQAFLGGKYALSGTYFRNTFRDQITFNFDFATFTSQYINLNRALAHGAEIEFHARPLAGLSLDAAYVHTSTQILDAPLASDPLLVAGAPLIRRPRHSGSMLVTYAAQRWGTTLGGTFVGRRTDSDFFLGLGVDHAAGYARFDTGAWYAVHRNVTLYGNIENFLNRKYEEAAGYPALKANFRAGMRFRFGGE